MLIPRLRPWLPVLAWAIFIFGSSTASFSTPHTSRILIPLLRWLLPGADEVTLELLHEFARKCVHFVNYFVLSVLLFRALAARPMPPSAQAFQFVVYAIAPTATLHLGYAGIGSLAAARAAIDAAAASLRYAPP